ncbi:MAG: type II toxin-antitoxin system VapC family toxin [Pseudomonadota bacterium]|nr:type II toxin-antitoxin system VapC family toxin [Pseudomonadota bacterium]
MTPEPKLLLDSNIVIALMNMHEGAAARLREHQPGSVAISTIVLQELIYGARKSQRVAYNLHKIAQLHFPVLDFTPQDADTAGRIRADLATNGTPIGPYDALIAAQALGRNLTLVTHNTREFRRVPGLRVIDWL